MTTSFTTLGAAATLTQKATNQDACGYIRRSGGGKAVLVADGLGSHFQAEVGSRLAVDAAKGWLADHSDGSLREAFARAAARIDAEATLTRASWPEGVAPDRAMGTTLICALEVAESIEIGYVGNGAILHVRGDFDQHPSARLLPWSSVNLLNPHSRPEQGQAALYKFLGPFQPPAQREPTVVRLSTDAELVGDIIVLCTDGIASYDQTPIGRDSSQRIWIAGDASLALLYAALGEFFVAGTYTDGALEATLQRYLSDLARLDLVEDDCTVGVLVTSRAVEYHALLLATRFPDECEVGR